MKRGKILGLLLVSILLISGGCASAGGIPDAKSDETYTATISAKGTAPFNCKQIGGTDIGGTLTLAQNCVISGTAPHATETKIIPFKVEMTDANGNSNIIDMTLTIQPPPVELQLPERINGNLGKYFKHNFCDPQPGLNCDKGVINPTGGNPPYTFTVSGQPIGLIMSLNGDLKGTIPELAREGEYPTEVCVKDTKGASDCGDTIIEIKKSPFEGEWEGSFIYTKDSFTFFGQEAIHTESSGTFKFTIGPEREIGSYNSNILKEDLGEQMYSLSTGGDYCSGSITKENIKIGIGGAARVDHKKGVITNFGVIPLTASGDYDRDSNFDFSFYCEDIEMDRNIYPTQWGEFDYRDKDITLPLKEGVAYEETLQEDKTIEKIKIELHKVE